MTLMSATTPSASIGKPAQMGSPLGLLPWDPGWAASRRPAYRLHHRPCIPATGGHPVGQVSPMACTHVLAQRSVVDSMRATSAHIDLAGTPHAAPLARIF